MTNDATGLRFLLWNINGNNLSGLIAELVAERRVDVAVLLECGANEGADVSLSPLIKDFRKSSSFQPTASVSGKLAVLVRNTEWGLNEVYYDALGRFTVRTLQFRGLQLLLAAVHLPSKLHWSDTDQAAQAVRIAAKLREIEDQEKNRRTILVGDFNMNPFDAGMVSAPGFHAMMSRDSIAAESRHVQGVEYPFFYNPMWSSFGDRTPGPAGTFFQRRANPVCYDWNMVDQVLLRPAVLSHFEAEVEIISRIGDTDLLTRRGRPSRRIASDHLPVILHLHEHEA